MIFPVSPDLNKGVTFGLTEILGQMPSRRDVLTIKTKCA